MKNISMKIHNIFPISIIEFKIPLNTKKIQEDLEKYKNSSLFKAVWAKTKPLFIEKAEAWSVDSIIKLD